MALYTITLYDYLKRHELPLIFDTIPKISTMSFKELFTFTYSDWEIGFETEESFERKLNALSEYICPLYVKKIDLITKEYDNIFNSKSTRRDYLNNIDVSTLTNDTGNNAQTLESITSGEVINGILTFQNKIKSVYSSLLKEFEKLFMGLC